MLNSKSCPEEPPSWKAGKPTLRSLHFEEPLVKWSIIEKRPSATILNDDVPKLSKVRLMRKTAEQEGRLGTAKLAVA